MEMFPLVMLPCLPRTTDVQKDLRESKILKDKLSALHRLAFGET